MKKILIFAFSILLVILIFLSACAPINKVIETTKNEEESSSQTSKKPFQTRTIIDMARREHEIPIVIDKVFATNPVGTTYIYTLAPEKLLGWNYQFNESELSYIKDEYKELTVFGTIKNANYEALISAGPDIIISAAGVDEKTASKIEDFQDQLGIPIIMIDESLLKSDEVYIFLGGLLNEEERASDLSSYAKAVLEKVDEVNIIKSEQVSIYFGNGINSLNTSSRGTPPSETFDLLNAVNVCALQGESPDRIEVTPEHIIKWNPDFMFINGEPAENLSGFSAAKSILENESYKNIKAVKNGNVINIPETPFAWLDRPRSANRLLGLLWAGNILYPQNFEFSNDDIKKFYKLFYHLDITDEDIAVLLK